MIKNNSKKNEPTSQMECIYSYFVERPMQDIAHAQVVDWATTYWKEKTGEVFRDPDRAIRKLHQEGKLQKIKKGVYRYAPDMVHEADLEDFSEAQKAEILKRGKYRCAMCGLGRAEGLDLCVDHIKPKDKGGRATLENGQVLCGPHNHKKKNYNQTETGKKMFINLYELAKSTGDTQHEKFAADLLAVFEKHGINGHIEWKKS